MTAGPPAELMRPRLAALAGYFLRLGSAGFGGPIALVGAMQQELIARRRWFSAAEFARSLALAQLAPGPLAAQVAFCLGYLHSRLRGAAVVALAFVLPSFLLTVAFGALYVRYGGMAWIGSVFYGVGAVVIGIIVVSAWRLARATAQGDPLLWSIAALVAAVTAWRARELLWLIALAGLVGMLAALRPKLRAGTLASVALLPQLFWYFAKAGSFVFGSGLAIVPFLYAGVVGEHRWLTEGQFLDAIAVAMMTPGPVVITAGFIGYLVAGPAGAVAATLGVFLPAFLLAVGLLPLFERIAGHPGLVGFVRGVTAAAAGAIAGACVVLSRGSIQDGATAALALLALVLTARTRIAPGLLVLGGGLAGLLLQRGGAGI